jgi:heme/copper-type cytochrome/quinol oxidase subunit 2
VAILLAGETIVTLPASGDSAAHIGNFYAAHSAIIVMAQVLSLLASALLLAFVVTVWRRTNRDSTVLLAGILVVLASVVTVVPVLALALLSHNAPATVHPLARAGDYTDAVLFAAIAVFGAAVARIGVPLWLRFLSAIVAALTIARAVVSPLGIATLDVIAPLAFLALIVAITVHLFRRPGLDVGQHLEQYVTRAS